MSNQLAKFKGLLDASDKVLIIQADNPDGDSLASSLALEDILEQMGKDTYMYCSIDMPDYLKHMSGWSRVSSQFPSSYDLAIMVDNSYERLLDNLANKQGLSSLKDKPLVILDHHSSETDIDYADVHLNDAAKVATGEVIYDVFQQLDPGLISLNAAEHITISILSDTLGLTSEALTNKPAPIRVLADLVEMGVDLSKLHEQRLERLKISQEVVRYRGELLQRIEFSGQGAIATITIPYQEIREHSSIYNPTIILDEMRGVEGVKVGIGFKQYESNGKLVRVTARIRCNRGFTIAQELAEEFGGGGHPYASGIKWEDSAGLDFDSIKADVLQKAEQLLQ